MSTLTLLNISQTTLRWKNTIYPCVLGEGGVTPHKKEGDKKTPVGTFRLLTVYYRPDRLPPPKTLLPLVPLTPSCGWCHDPKHIQYNQFVKLPFEGGHEVLWRTDERYNLIVTTSHNINPTVAGSGSAIFIHIAKETTPGQLAPTQGCLALRQEDLLTILEEANHTTTWTVPNF